MTLGNTSRLPSVEATRAPACLPSGDATSASRPRRRGNRGRGPQQVREAAGVKGVAGAISRLPAEAARIEACQMPCTARPPEPRGQRRHRSATARVARATRVLSHVSPEAPAAVRRRSSLVHPPPACVSPNERSPLGAYLSGCLKCSPRYRGTERAGRLLLPFMSPALATQVNSLI